MEVIQKFCEERGIRLYDASKLSFVKYLKKIDDKDVCIVIDFNKALPKLKKVFETNEKKIFDDVISVSFNNRSIACNKNKFDRSILIKILNFTYEGECPICLESNELNATFTCNYCFKDFHRDCILEAFTCFIQHNKQNFGCPACRGDIEDFFDRVSTD